MKMLMGWTLAVTMVALATMSGQTAVAQKGGGKGPLQLQAEAAFAEMCVANPKAIDAHNTACGKWIDVFELDEQVGQVRVQKYNGMTMAHRLQVDDLMLDITTGMLTGNEYREWAEEEIGTANAAWSSGDAAFAVSNWQAATIHYNAARESYLYSVTLSDIAASSYQLSINDLNSVMAIFNQYP